MRFSWNEPSVNLKNILIEANTMKPSSQGRLPVLGAGWTVISLANDALWPSLPLQEQDCRESLVGIGVEADEAYDRC